MSVPHLKALKVRIKRAPLSLIIGHAKVPEGSGSIPAPPMSSSAREQCQAPSQGARRHCPVGALTDLQKENVALQSWEFHQK